MSPRRGGSSSSGSSSGGSSSSGSSGSSSSSGTRSGSGSGSTYYFPSSSCATLDGDFGTTYISIFVIEGLCLIIVLLTALLWLFFSLRRRKTPDASPVQRVLRFYSYGVLLFFFILFLLLSILQAALNVCFISTRFTSQSLAAAYNVFSGIVELILLPLFTIVFVRYLLATKARSTGLATIVNGVIFGIIAVLWLPLYVLYPYIIASNDATSGTVEATFRLSAAYNFLYLVAAIVASAFILSAVIPSSVPSFGVKCKIFTLFALLMFCIYPFVNFIRDAAYSAAGRPLSVSGSVVFRVFIFFSLVLAVLGLLLAVHTAKPRGAVAGAPSTTTAAPMAHDGKVYGYEQQQQQAGSSQAPSYQQHPQQQVPPPQQPVYPNSGVYNQGGGFGSSGMVFYNPPGARA